MLGALGKYSDDLMEAGQLGLGVVVGQVGWGFLAPVIPSAVAGIHPAAGPALELVAGAAALAFLPKKGWMGKVATGVGAGLAAGGVVGLLGAFGVLSGRLAFAQAAGAAGAAGPASSATSYLGAAPLTVEEVAGLAGAPVTVEEVAGLGSLSSTFY